jgi:hypothetical protein
VWTWRDTFGFVLIDFEDRRKKNERLIGKGEVDLFRKLKSTYKCVLLSNRIDRNFKEFEINGRRSIRVNLVYFKEFLSVIRDKSSTVGLFLYRFSSNAEEQLVRRWLMSYDSFKEIMKKVALDNVDAIMEILNTYHVKGTEDLDRLLTITRASDDRIRSSSGYFRERLDEFQAKVDGNASEDDLRQFLFDNIWLLDFQYMKYRKIAEEATSVGNVDISLYKDSYGIERLVLIEMKKSAKDLTETSYRGEKKPVIRAEVGKAVSQAIHYIEQKRSPGRTITGLVIFGRKMHDKDEFIEKFNQYLHGVQVITYDEICDRTRIVIDSFDAPAPAKSS